MHHQKIENDYLKTKFKIEKEKLCHILRIYENNPKLEFKNEQKLLKFIKRNKIFAYALIRVGE